MPANPVVCRGAQKLADGRFRLKVLVDIAIGYEPFTSTSPGRCPGLRLNFLAGPPMTWSIKAIGRQENAMAAKGPNSVKLVHFIVLTVLGKPHWDARDNMYRFDVDTIEVVDDRG